MNSLLHSLPVTNSLTPSCTIFAPQVCMESQRFEKLMEYFKNEDNNIDFMVACMQFINIVVHSVEDMNFRVHLQYNFTKLGLDDYLDVKNYVDAASKQRPNIKPSKSEVYKDTTSQIHSLRQMLKEKDEAIQRQSKLEKKIHELEKQGTIRIQKKGDGDISILPFAPLGVGGLPGAMLGANGAAVDQNHAGVAGAQGPSIDVTISKQKVTHKGPNKVALLDSNRAKNLAITLRKVGKTTEEICKAIQLFDLRTLPVDFVECLMRFQPTENEVKVLRQFEKERKPLESLTDEDRFMMQFSKIERLMQKMTIMAFIGNFSESVQMLTPVIKTLLDTKSTDRKITLLHYIANVVKEKYPQASLFHNELHYVEKAAAVSLENVLLDVKELQRGMELTRREYSMHGHNTMLKDFITHNESKLKKLQDDAKVAQSPSHKSKRQQQELIQELRKKQVKDSRHVYEGKDGAIEDIITGNITRSMLKTVPFTARTAKRGSRFFCEPALNEEYHY
ncbi:hypothetical protein GOODEAATRI_004873 [Goodea atripinnis]|uniref:FH2 domain-containing protein n=1 Tax=Goodea atripinnis TaxID=208336 RepID=A0ABV0PKX4_9TELE